MAIGEQSLGVERRIVVGFDGEDISFGLVVEASLDGDVLRVKEITGGKVGGVQVVRGDGPSA